MEVQLKEEVQLREEEGRLPREAREEVGMCPGDDLGGQLSLCDLVGIILHLARMT